MRKMLPAAGLLLSLVMAGVAIASSDSFSAHLAGRNEVPPVETIAQGGVQFRLNDAGTAMTYKLNVADIDEVSQAHIHCGPEGVNGPIVVFLAGPFVPVTDRVNGTLAEGTISQEDIIPAASSAACPGGIATFEQLIEKMRGDGTYANVHTTPHPNGEIRGQIR